MKQPYSRPALFAFFLQKYWRPLARPVHDFQSTVEFAFLKVWIPFAQTVHNQTPKYSVNQRDQDVRYTTFTASMWLQTQILKPECLFFLCVCVYPPLGILRGTLKLPKTAEVRKDFLPFSSLLTYIVFQSKLLIADFFYLFKEREQREKALLRALSIKYTKVNHISCKQK